MEWGKWMLVGAMVAYLVLDRPRHRVLLPEVQALRCSGRLHVLVVPWVALVVAVVALPLQQLVVDLRQPLPVALHLQQLPQPHLAHLTWQASRRTSELEQVREASAHGGAIAPKASAIAASDGPAYQKR